MNDKFEKYNNQDDETQTAYFFEDGECCIFLMPTCDSCLTACESCNEDACAESLCNGSCVVCDVLSCGACTDCAEGDADMAMCKLLCCCL